MVKDGPNSGLLRRDLELEQNVVRRAARGLMDPEPLITQARKRSTELSGDYVPDPFMIRLGMFRPTEAMEEAVDGVNHLLFHFQEHPEDPANDDYRAALRHFLLAYDRIANAGSI